MLHLMLDQRILDKIAAAAVLNGRSMTEEIKARIESSFKPAKASG